MVLLSEVKPKSASRSMSFVRYALMSSALHSSTVLAMSPDIPTLICTKS